MAIYLWIPILLYVGVCLQLHERDFLVFCPLNVIDFIITQTILVVTPKQVPECQCVQNKSDLKSTYFSMFYIPEKNVLKLFVLH